MKTLAVLLQATGLILGSIWFIGLMLLLDDLLTH